MKRQLPNPTFGRTQRSDPALDRALTDVATWGQRLVTILNRHDSTELVNTLPVPVPTANITTIYTMDVAGKTALMVQFPTGAAIQLAIEV